MEKFFGNTLWVTVLIAGLCMFLILSIGTLDVLAYLLFKSPFSGANEIVEVVLAVCVAMAIVSAHYTHSHVRVDIISENFPKKINSVVDIFGRFLGAACTFALAYSSWKLAIDSVLERETAITLYSFPVYPGKILFATGLTIAAMESIRQFAMACLRRHDRLAGPINMSVESMGD